MPTSEDLPPSPLQLRTAHDASSRSALVAQRLCENARDFDANGTAHHFGSASVKTSDLSPPFGLFPSVKQVAITTDFLNFTFLDSLGRVEMWRGGLRFGVVCCRPFRLAVP